ncbi:MAG: holo-[acyl-carrier-protein] synthase [Paraburkholderia sp.]|uniref:holo-ACP synthase n=1 Tax=Paraburkholderia sp. TaxID=1926495 RepID=UPI00120E57A4|nr:holo-ACP synthase [Paraburkholderia sp.]TAM00729.1 MAG: holo-[acyl-carrier-protein] synthase [Paraburkholderia sp.]
MHIGIDIVENERISRALYKSGQAFFERFTSPEEREWESTSDCNIERLAGIWASKEAAVKALGTGFRNGIVFHDIRICHGALGEPYYTFRGEFKRIMTGKGLNSATLSISHCGTHTVAVAVLS